LPEEILGMLEPEERSDRVLEESDIQAVHAEADELMARHTARPAKRAYRPTRISRGANSGKAATAACSPVHGAFREAVLGPPSSAGYDVRTSHHHPQPRSRGFSLFGFSNARLQSIFTMAARMA
jgi:hypothetical protein